MCVCVQYFFKKLYIDKLIYHKGATIFIYLMIKISSSIIQYLNLNSTVKIQ